MKLTHHFVAHKSNYAFNPIAEQDLRSNQTTVPQRVNAALGINGRVMRAIVSRAIGVVVLCAGCTSGHVSTPEFPAEYYRVSESKLSPKEQIAVTESVRSILGCLDAPTEVDCGLKLNIFEGERRTKLRKYFSGNRIDRIWMNRAGTSEQVFVEFPWPDQGGGGVLIFNINGLNIVPYGATQVMP